MRIVLDCNVFLVSISSKSPYHKIFKRITSGSIQLIVSNDILLEYLEVISLKANPEIATYVVDMIIAHPLTIMAEPFYQFKLIEKDSDDNKYADLAISNNAEYLVTNDAHFNILKQMDFPKVNVVSGQEFLDILSATPEK